MDADSGSFSLLVSPSFMPPRSCKYRSYRVWHHALLLQSQTAREWCQLGGHVLPGPASLLFVAFLKPELLPGPPPSLQAGMGSSAPQLGELKWGTLPHPTPSSAESMVPAS